MSPVFRNPCFYFTSHFWGVLLCFYIYSTVLLSTGIVNRQNPHLCGISTVARKMENKQLKKVNFIDMLESLPMVTVAMKLKDDPWKNAITNLDSILNRDIMLLTKVRIIKAMVFSVVMYGCESWTMKKAEHRRTGAFELWCWRRLLRVPWTTRR